MIMDVGAGKTTMSNGRENWNGKSSNNHQTKWTFLWALTQDKGKPHDSLFTFQIATTFIPFVYSMQTRLADSVENAQQLSLTIASSSSFLVLLSDGPSWIQLELQCCMEMPVTTNYQASSTYFVPLWGHREKGRGREPSRLMASKLLLHHCKACNFLLKKEMHYL